jgi:hypothetical protein
MFDKIVKFISTKIFNKTMYPEIEKAGSLSNALNIEFAKINSPLKVAIENNIDKLPFDYARVENKNKFSQVYIGAEKKLYLPDFWRDGVCLAHGQTENILELATVLDFWLNQDITTNVLAEKFKFVKPNDNAKAFDENNEVEFAWNYILQSDSKTGLHEFVKLAIKDEFLSKLFPFTSLYTLCFSKCTGYPFDSDNLPNITPKQFENFAPIINEYIITEYDNNKLEQQFVVTKNTNEYLGEGNAKQALKIVKNNLPDNIRPAKKGTADN